MQKQSSAARKSKDPGRRSTDTVRTETPARRRPVRELPLGPAFRARQERELRARLAPHVSGRLHVVITDNRAVMISVQRNVKQLEYRVRLHHLFAGAPDPILHALGRYIAFNDAASSRELNAFIDEKQDRIGPEPPAQPTTLRTDGRYFDLAALFEELNQTYFDGQVTCGITWGRHVGRGKARRSIKVGSYCVEQDLIRIHPGLDREWIPLFYIQWVLFHEMLHAVHPIPVVNGRRQFHTEAFAQEERRFAQYDRATQWEKRNVAALLCI